jgi:hypothetical protein
MTEIITNLSKDVEYDNDEIVEFLTIETIKNMIKWYAYIAIHIPKNNFIGCINVKQYICDITLNFHHVNNYKRLIGRKIIKKEQVQFDEHTEGTPKYSSSHMTKLVFYLEKLKK